jgi:hypothetical protein
LKIEAVNYMIDDKLVRCLRFVKPGSNEQKDNDKPGYQFGLPMTYQVLFRKYNLQFNRC